MSVINFALSSAEFIENTNNALFRKMRIRAFASGENAHTLPVDESVIRRCAYSIYDKPIVWKYNKIYNDAMGHEIDEVPVGFIKETDENPIIFEQDEDGRIFITVDALIWTKYCGKLIEVFENSGNCKDVSIEINVLAEDVELCDKPLIKEFCVAGITILGEMINPAVKGCKATLLEFSQDMNEYLNNFSFDDSIKIDNSKDSSVDGKWENPRRKLFNPIIKSNNYEALLKEAYLIGDFSTNEPEITKFKYPHHIIKNGKLIVHKNGLISAFQRASQQGIVNENIKSHLLKHYKELGLSIENFTDFSMSEDDFNLYFKNILIETESGCETSMDNEIKNSIEEQEVDNAIENAEIDNSTEEVDNSVEFSEATEEMSETTEEVVENSDEDNVEINNSENENNNEDIEEVSDDEDEKDDEDSDNNDSDNDDTQQMSLEQAMCEIAKMSETIARLEADNNAYMAKIESMSDYEDLKKFRCETEEKMAREAEMSEMEAVMSEISERGFSFSDDDKKALMDDFKNFSSIDAWKNYVKAQVFDKADTTGIVRMGLTEITNKTSGSIWDRI